MTRIWDPSVPIAPADLKVGDKVKAVYIGDAAVANRDIIGTIDTIWGRSNDFEIIDEHGQHHVLWQKTRKFYLLEPVGWREEKKTDPPFVQVDVAGRPSWRLQEGDHLRIWIEGGQTHVEVTFL